MKSKSLLASLAAILVGGLTLGGTAFAAESPASQKAGDAALLAKIKSNLLRSSEVEGLDVNVDVRDGVVTLSGSADTETERASAEKIAKTSEGVKSVDNRIVIKPDAAASKPAVPPPALPPTTPPPPATPGSPPPVLPAPSPVN
jgi:hypothetical protein